MSWTKSDSERSPVRSGAQFDSLSPKRPLKPNRSEPDSSPPMPDKDVDQSQTIPELDKFRSLQSQSQSGQQARISDMSFIIFAITSRIDRHVHSYIVRRFS